MNDFVEVEHIKRTYELRRFPPKAYNFFIQTAQMNESNQRTAMRGHLSSGKYRNNNESEQASTNGRYILKEDQEFSHPSENFPSKRVRSTDGMNVVLRSKVEKRSRLNMSLPQVTALSQKDSQGQTVKTHNSHGLVKIHPGRNVTSDGFGSTVKPNEVDRMTRGPDFQSITKRSGDPSSMRHGNSQSFSSICQNIWTSDSGHQQSTRDCVRPYQNSFLKAVNEDIYENCQNIHHDSSSHWIEAETGRVAILEEQVRQISEERRSLIAQNSALAYKLRKSAQLVSENEYLDQVLLRVQTIVKRIKHEHLMLRSEMDQLLQRKLHHIIDTRRQLLLEHATLQAQLEEKIASQMLSMNASCTYPNDAHHSSSSTDFHQELCTYTGDEGIETLRIKLRELEKRCALQQLLQEEVLLELEGARKRERLTEANEQLFSSADQAYRSTLADFSNISLSTSGLAKVDYANYNRSTEATDFSLGSGSTGSTTRVNIKRCVLGSGPVAVGKPVTSDEQDPNLVELFQTSDEPFEISDIRAPRMLTLERQLVHSVLISWKPPDVTTTGQTVSAYHVYVDGQFRLAVKAKEKTRALLDRVDADKPHRISVRAISTKGQSKDAACTLVVGRGMTATPGRLRATQITTNSAKLSWMPGNSNYWHRIFLNQQELCTCPPGVYKVLLTDLPPDALHWVCVQAVVQKTNIPESQKSPMSIICSPRSGVDTQKLAAFIEFRTLPIGLPDPPTNVQLEPGPQDGMLLVTWLPVPQDQGAAAAATAAGAGITLPVQGYTVCLNENSLVEVAESTNDHAIIPLQQIKCHLEAAGTTSSVTRSSETETSEATLADNRQLSPDLPDTGIPQHLFITVHSTVPREATESKTAFANSESPIKSNILKGAAGPGSLPVNLTAGLLLASAGSLQAARRIFGSRLSLHLGIDEAAAKRAGVPLIVEREMSTSPPPTTQVGHVSTLDPGLVMVSADLTARKLSPTADAIGSAEALLRRRKLDDNEEHSAPNSSPEMNLPEIERGFHRNRFRSHPIHSSEPWPWPESHAGRPGHPSHLPVTRRPPTNSSYARKSWRQFRSLSDDHDPRLFYAEQIDLDDFREDSNDTAPSQDVRVSGPNRWFRTSSLYNIHQKRPIRGRRPRGSAKSSWDLRNLEVSPRYLEDEQFKRGDGIRFCSARCQRFPVDQSYQEYTARCGSMPWDEVTHRGAAAPYSVFTKFGHRFRDQFETEVPGPIIRAFSSSSNDDKYSYYVPDIFTEQRFSSGQVMLPTRKPGYYRPRSRSASPHRPQHQYGPRVVPTTWASRLFEFDNQVAPEAQGYWPPNPSRTHRSLIRHAGHGSVGSRHKAHTSGHPVHSVPEIQIHQDSETSGPLRRTRSKHMDLRGYHEELRPELTPQHFKITEQLVDPCSQQPKFVHAPKSSVEGRRKLQNTAALPGTAPFLSNYPSEPPFPSTSGTHDTTHINTSSRVPQELTQPVPPPVALDEFQRSYHKDGGDQSSTYGLPVQQRFQDTKALRFVVALYAYDPATMSPNPDAVQEELPFQEGQIIKIFGDCDEDGFYYGECNGLRGLVPSNMVSKPERDIGPTDSTYPGTSNRMEQVMNQERPRYPEGPSLPPGQLSRPRHRHYGTMHASHQNVPSHQISDTMTGRPYGSTSAIQNGVAFATQSHSRRSPLDNPPLPQCKSTNTVANLYAQEDPCYDFSRQPSMREPSLRTSQQPISRQMRAPQLAGANDPGKQSLPGMSRQMVALYDYDPSVLSPNADADRELSFRSGERIVVYGEMDEDGFYEGELSDGRRGLVPSNFLRDIRTDIDPMDRRASITARSSQKRSQADSGSFMNSTYKNETSQAPTGPSTSAGYRRDQEKLVPLGREQLRGMNFGRKTAGGQLGIHDESKDVKYVQARMSQGRHGIEEDPYWDQQSTFEGDAQKW